MKIWYVAVAHNSLPATNANEVQFGGLPEMVELHDYLELRAKYEERGAAMRETGDMVRSLYEPKLKKLEVELKGEVSLRQHIEGNLNLCRHERNLADELLVKAGREVERLQIALKQSEQMRITLKDDLLVERSIVREKEKELADLRGTPEPTYDIMPDQKGEKI